MAPVPSRSSRWGKKEPLKVPQVVLSTRISSGSVGFLPQALGG